MTNPSRKLTTSPRKTKWSQFLPTKTPKRSRIGVSRTGPNMNSSMRKKRSLLSYIFKTRLFLLNFLRTSRNRHSNSWRRTRLHFVQSSDLFWNTGVCTSIVSGIVLSSLLICATLKCSRLITLQKSIPNYLKLSALHSSS